jgi:succinoglycan biosynthesis protein ExoV
VEEVLAQIQQTELLLAEAMHGAIVADALRVPWIAIRLYGNFLEFKWQDWTQSLKLPLKVTALPPIFSRPAISPKGLVQAVKKTVAASGLGKEKWKRFRIGASSEAEISKSLRALEKMGKAGAPCLSDEKVLKAAETRLFEKLGALRADWAAHRFSPVPDLGARQA